MRGVEIEYLLVVDPARGYEFVGLPRPPEDPTCFVELVAVLGPGRESRTGWSAAGIAIAEAAGCSVSGLAGDPLNTGRGLLISADEVTHQSVLSLIAPHLTAVTATA